MYDSGSASHPDQATAHEIKFIELLTLISSLSMFGSVAIIVTYFLFKDLQTTSRKIVVYISIGDFLTVYPTLVYTWHDRHSMKKDFNCVFQSFVTSTAVMWSFFWTSCLAIYLYFALVKKRHEMAEKLMVIFHIINWGIPLVLVGAAWGANYLSSPYAKTSGGWCWIKADKSEHWKSVLWMLVCGKLWEVASYFIDGILYFVIRKKIKEEIREMPPHGLSDEAIQTALQGERKLILVPILFVFCRIWGTIRFFIFCITPSWFNKDHTIDKVLLICHIVGDNIQGFANFILFCLLTVKFRENIKQVFCHRKRKSDRERDLLIPKTEQNKPVHKYISKEPGTITFYT